MFAAIPLLAPILGGLNALFNSTIGRWLIVGVLVVIGAFAWTKHIESRTRAEDNAKLQAGTTIEHTRREAAEQLAQQAALESLKIWEQRKSENETVRTVVVREKTANDRSTALGAAAIERLRSVGGGH